MDVERLNKPALAVIDKDFRHDLISAASSRGMPGLRFVVENVPGECVIEHIIDAQIDERVINEVIEALTKALTEEEKHPKRDIQKIPRIIFKGDLTEVNRFFYMRGFTDGLPIIPPTEEAVQEMLTGTDLPAEYVVSEEIPPRLAKATVEKIAINAVMAGALPTYMPLLIAGTKTLADTKAAFGIWGVSTGSWAPFWIVNGSIRKEIDIYGGVGALSPGHIANATIGRAMGLIARNIGGVRQGIEDMGVHGNPCKYSMVTGENEEESPWEPLHVERGLNKEDSAITLFYPNSYVQVLTYSHDARGILNTAIYNIPPARGGILSLILNPALAKILADEGWSKKDIQRFMKEYARCPRDKHWFNSMRVLPKELIPFSEQDSTPLIAGNEQVIIIVSGKFSSYVGLAMGGMMPEVTFVTKKVELPANWKQLVQEYKNIVPTYIRY